MKTVSLSGLAFLTVFSACRAPEDSASDALMMGRRGGKSLTAMKKECEAAEREYAKRQKEFDAFKPKVEEWKRAIEAAKPVGGDEEQTNRFNDWKLKSGHDLASSKAVWAFEDKEKKCGPYYAKLQRDREGLSTVPTEGCYIFKGKTTLYRDDSGTVGGLGNGEVRIPVWVHGRRQGFDGWDVDLTPKGYALNCQRGFIRNAAAGSFAKPTPREAEACNVACGSTPARPPSNVAQPSSAPQGNARPQGSGDTSMAGKCIYMLITGGPAPAYKDRYMGDYIRNEQGVNLAVGNGIPVIRKLTVRHDNGVEVADVTVRDGSLKGMGVWVETKYLTVRSNSWWSERNLANACE